jgi:hypothetical protein
MNADHIHDDLPDAGRLHHVDDYGDMRVFEYVAAAGQWQVHVLSDDPDAKFLGHGREAS